MNLRDFINKTPLSSQWNSIGFSPHHGIATPLGAIRSQQSSGIGEYLDLLVLIDLCKEVGFDIIQLLPLNDSGDDPSPYNALSSNALHPIYLSLTALPYLNEHPYFLPELESFKILNSSYIVEYCEILAKKLSFLKRYVDLTKDAFISDSSYQHFLKQHQWLQDYAIYKSIKQTVSFNSWQEWPEKYKTLTPPLKEELLKEQSEWIDFFSILQFLCFSQLESVKRYAEKSHIFLMGDIPILISPDSADVWSQRQFFDMNYSVGFPPDVYSKEGQLWGFPALRWDVLASAEYSWWKQRLQVASSFYHLYRIDHVAGFYRLWLIERGKLPKDGSFFPSQLEKCIENGHHHLNNVISFSPMLPIAEDLGLIPKEMSSSLKHLGIAGTKVLRWERAWCDDKRFTVVEDYPILSMSCVSTHDSATLSLWWRDFSEEAKEFCSEKGWTYSEHLTKEQRIEILKDCHKAHSIFHINLLSEYIAIFDHWRHRELDDERINIPGVVSSKNWRYKIQDPLETFLNDEDFKKSIKALLK